MPFEPASGLLVGNRYRLDRLVGEGGMGAVWAATHTITRKTLALKFLKAPEKQRAELTLRFLREARAACAVEHPNVVQIHDVLELDDGTPVMVMEMLAGESLQQKLERERRIELGELASLMLPVLSAVGAAHVAGVVHRDLKPDNIFLARGASGRITVKVLDFGIAKIVSGRDGSESSGDLTGTGSLLGTPFYMSPEQVGGEKDLDYRSDIWALGVILYQCLAGVLPTQGESLGQIIKLIMDGPIRPLAEAAPWLPADVLAIVEQMLCRGRAARLSELRPLYDVLTRHVGADRLRLAFFARLAAQRALPASGSLASLFDDEIDSMAPSRASLAAVMHPPLPLAAVSPGGAPDDDGAPSGEASPSRWPMAAASEALATAAVVDQRALGAYGALRLNALDEAIAHAEAAIGTNPTDVEHAGPMHLVLAIAHNWLGNFVGAKRSAEEAARALPAETTGWYSALGYAAMAGSALGQNDDLSRMAERLFPVDTSTPAGDALMIAACRLAIVLVRAGAPGGARDILARTHCDAGASANAVAQAWLDVARGEIDQYDGDLCAYLRHLECAVEHFTTAGDVRNVCLQTCNVANARIQLGDLSTAERLLRESIAVAEPMKLHFVAAAKANLGYLLTRLGRSGEALSMLQNALDESLRHNNRRIECAARVYSAMARRTQGTDALARAAEDARRAIERAEPFPSWKALGLATLADIQLHMRQPEAAVQTASAAMSLLEQHGGTEEGESLVRLLYASTLHATGNIGAARDALANARDRLLTRARLITDAGLRKAFLNVVENARTLDVAAEWFGASSQC